MANFDQYCENCAHNDTFGQYQEVEIDEGEEEEVWWNLQGQISYAHIVITII
mgnify:CR=1 FL=1